MKKVAYLECMVMSILVMIMLVACGNVNTEEPNETSGDIVITQQDQKSEQKETTEEEYEDPFEGVYLNKHISILYDSKVLQLEELMKENDDVNFYLSITPKGSEGQALPRIDITGTDISALTPDSMDEYGEEIMFKDFENFAASMVYSYYNAGRTEDGTLIGEEPAFIPHDTYMEVTSTSKYAYTALEIEKTKTLPEMVAYVQLAGIGDNGAASIFFTPKEVEQETYEKFIDVMEHIKYLDS